MTTPTTPPPSPSDSPTGSEPQSQSSGPRKRRGRRILLFSGLGLAALSSFAALRVFAHGRGHGHGFGRFGAMRASSAREVQEHLSARAEHLTRSLDLSEGQQRQLDALIERISPELFALKQRGRALHDEAHSAFEQGDRQALEVSRKRGIAWIDEMSALWLGALGDFEQVLDASQRTKLREHFAH